MPLIRSISGIRGTLGDSLSPDAICRYVAAYAQSRPGTEVVVGFDGRPSGAWIQMLVAGTLMSCGVHVRLLGMVPTPTVQLHTEKSKASGGISITASHNPFEWNGLKFLEEDGVFLDDAACADLFVKVDGSGGPYAPWDGGGHQTVAVDPIDAHINAALSLSFVDIQALQDRKFKVVVDAVNASGSVIVPRLLETLGCQVVRLHCEGNGQFPHTPEPLPENLLSLCGAVKSEGADLGIAVDPDADRLVLIDERGEPFGEEYTITQAAKYILSNDTLRRPNTERSIAVNLSTTRAIDDVAVEHDARVYRTRVGEVNVVNAMKQHHCILGGEGSGGIILPTLHYGRDSLAGIVITLMHLLSRGGTLSELKASLPQYAIAKRRIDLAGGIHARDAVESVRSKYADTGKVNMDDGIRVDFERSWIHVRGSNTEPIVRVIAEAPTMAEAMRMTDEVETILRG